MESRRGIPSGNSTDKLPVGLARVVRGRVTDSDMHPVSQLLVMAFDRNLGIDDRLLGQALTDALGDYFITYTGEQLQGKSAADLVICLYRNSHPCETSDVIFDAGRETVKDFRITISPAEFDRLVAQIEPLLRTRLRLEALGSSQASFLTKKSSAKGGGNTNGPA